MKRFCISMSLLILLLVVFSTSWQVMGLFLGLTAKGIWGSLYIVCFGFLVIEIMRARGLVICSRVEAALIILLGAISHFISIYLDFGEIGFLGCIAVGLIFLRLLRSANGLKAIDRP